MVSDQGGGADDPSRDGNECQDLMDGAEGSDEGAQGNPVFLIEHQSGGIVADDVLFIVERGHVDDEAVFDVAFEHAFVGFVDLVHADHFDVRGDVVLAAEVEHFLGFGEAADEGAGEGFAAHDEGEGGYGEGFLRGTDEGKVAIDGEHVEVGVDVVIGGDAVEDEVEGAGVFGHLG